MVINMRLSDLQNKDVVDVETGEKIGNVIDVLIDNANGAITKLIIYGKRGIFNMLKQEEMMVSWTDIKKIGADVILIKKN